MNGQLYVPAVSGAKLGSKVGGFLRVFGVEAKGRNCAPDGDRLRSSRKLVELCRTSDIMGRL
jgi:hypothetical protein